MILKADFYKLIVWYYRKAEEFEKDVRMQGIRENRSDEERMNIVFRYVRENYMYPITTSDAADYVFLSYSYFLQNV